ncbi:hypothetical protein ACFLY6_00620 [Candidatus Dependentiae bacterium]
MDLLKIAKKLPKKAWAIIKPLLIMQSVATLAAFPFLVFWGLPLSRMSLVGNILFSPILTAFLLLSSMLFITEILSIPNWFICKALEKTTKIWTYFLGFGSKSWLMPISYGSAIAIIFLLVLLTFHVKNKKMLSTQAILMLLPVVIAVAPTPNIFSWNKTFVARKNKGKLTIKSNFGNSVEVDDFYFFSKHKNSDKMVSFELKPFLAKHFGTFNISSVKIKKPSIRTVQACTSLCQLCRVDKIIMPTPKPNLYKDAKGQKSFENVMEILRTAALENGTEMIVTA